MFIISKEINQEQVVHYFSPLLKERACPVIVLREAGVR